MAPYRDRKKEREQGIHYKKSREDSPTNCIRIRWKKRDNESKEATSEAIQEVLSASGLGTQVVAITPIEMQPVCFVHLEQVDHAARARKCLLQSLPWSDVAVNFAVIDVNDGSKEQEIECTSRTAGVVVPGLSLVTDYVTEREAQALVADIDAGTRWTSLKSCKRRVMHYLYGFNYKKNEVDYEAGFFPPPPSLGRLLDQIRASHQPVQTLNQCTINDYNYGSCEGSGIRAHVDTDVTFGKEVYILSLMSALVMKFESVEDGTHKLLALPPRSLLVLTGDSRYKWSHAISGRKFDMLDGVLERRSRRVSVTVRHTPVVNSPNAE